MSALECIKAAEKVIKSKLQEIDEISYENQIKVLESFKSNDIQDYHFNQTSGYGYGDSGRDSLEAVYSRVFEAEDSLVRSQIVSGTHAISTCLTGILRPGDLLVSASGPPYDTLKTVIGYSKHISGSITDRGVLYQEIPLNRSGLMDIEYIQKCLNVESRLVMIQRSRGYGLRQSFTIPHIREACQAIRARCPEAIIFIDNCYGEFTDTLEPLQAGADIIAGSLIKNPGGGLAPSGGYIAGRETLVEAAAFQLTAPGLGKELGASLINPRLLYQGLFLAPHISAQALKTAILLAYLFEDAGYECYPRWDEPRGDIVQAIAMKNQDEVRRFCQIIQSNSPVNSRARLEYAPLPGYDSQIIMAAGTFIQGSSIELSCDAPLRPPYCVFLQGGLTYEHGRYVAACLLEQIHN